MRVLFIDDEEDLRRAVAQTFTLADLDVTTFSNAGDAFRHVTRDSEVVIVSDIRMPGMDGMDVLRAALDIDFELPVVLVTGHGDVTMAVEAMRTGAYDFIEKPFAPEHLVEVVRRAMDKRRLTLENRELRGQLTSRTELETRLTGRTPIMIELRRQILAVAASDADVFVRGETGTGKEVVARALHELSDRRDGPFVAINCGALDTPTLESDLFGHEAGAFPGALRARYGKLEHARSGTVFLDDVGAMPDSVQMRFLRVIEDRQISRLGSNELIGLDVRFIAASKDDLEDAVQLGTFRNDLYYRLSPVTLSVPPLSERREDIPRLFIQLANEAARRYRREFPQVPNSLLARLAAADWPGNVRQLRNEADRFVLGLQDGPAEAQEDGETLAARMASHEKTILALALKQHGGRLRPVYESLGISRKSLYEKMQRHGLEREKFRS